jgi:hypothetical protein
MNQQIGVGHRAAFSCSGKEYLAGLLGGDSQTQSLNPRPSHAIRWTTAEALVAQAKRIHELHNRSFWQQVKELHEERLSEFRRNRGSEAEDQFHCS